MGKVLEWPITKEEKDQLDELIEKYGEKVVANAIWEEVMRKLDAAIIQGEEDGIQKQGIH